MRHTSLALFTGFQTSSLPISSAGAWTVLDPPLRRAAIGVGQSILRDDKASTDASFLSCRIAGCTGPGGAPIDARNAAGKIYHQPCAVEGVAAAIEPHIARHGDDPAGKIVNSDFAARRFVAARNGDSTGRGEDRKSTRLNSSH